MKNFFLKTGLPLITLLIMAGGTAGAHHSQGNFTVYPTYMHGDSSRWIILDAVQGTTLRDFVTLENLTEQTQTISLVASEAEESETSYLIKDSANPDGLLSWIKFDKTEYILEPGQKIKAPFEISVPASAAIMGHTGAILASQTSQNDHSLNIVTRIGVRLYLNVVAPGTPLQNTISQTATVPAPFGIETFMGNTYLILTSLALAGSVIYTIFNGLNKRKYAKKQA